MVSDSVNNRIHGTTGRKPVDMLIEKNLSNLPAETVITRFLYEPRKVSNDGFVSYDGVKYGVP